MNSQDIQNKSNALITALANLDGAQKTVTALQDQLETAQAKLDDATKAAAMAQAELQNAISPPKPTQGDEQQ